MLQHDDFIDGTQENSELFRYFKEIGILDSEELNGSIIFARDLAEEKPKKPTCLYTPFQGLNQVYLRTLLNCEDSTYVRAAVENILKSMLMIREDSYHVEYIMSQAEPKHCQKRSSQVKYQTPLMLFAALCIVCGLPMKIVCGIFVFIAVVFTFFYVWRKFHALCMKQNVQKVKRLLFLQNEMILLVKKSLCLLRSRASNSSDPAIYTRGLFSKTSFVEKSTFLEQFATIPVLRNCVLETVLNMTKHMHSVTKNMIETIPLISQIDDTYGYLCSCEWSKLGLEEFTPNNHGDITLDVLQRLTSFFIIIQSEFLRRLSLSLCPEIWLKCTSETCDAIWAAVENMSWEITRNSFKLTKHYWLYCGYKKQSNICIKKLKPKPLFCHNVDLFQTFQEWFLTVQEISNCISFCTKQIESKNLEENGDKTVKIQFCDMLDEVMVELEALLKKSRSHFEICLKKLGKCFHNSDVSEQKCLVFVEPDEDEHYKTLPVGCSDRDLEVEDEVFEDEIFSDFQTKDEDFDSEMIVEETKNKIRKKHYAMLFLELKNVLAHRKEKIQEREAKALENKLRVTQCSNLQFLSESFNLQPLSEQSKCEVLFKAPKEFSPSENFALTVGKDQCDLRVQLSGSEDHVEFVNVNPVTRHLLTGSSQGVTDSSQVVEVSDENFKNINSDCKTTALKLLKLRKNSNGSIQRDLCDENICDSDTKTFFRMEALSLHDHHPFCGENRDKVKEDENVVSKNVSLLQPSIVSKLAFEAAEVASGTERFEICSESPADTDIQVFSLNSSLCCNKLQLMEDTFLYEPDEGS